MALRVEGLFKPQIIFLYLYICSLYCILICTVCGIVILNLVVLNEAPH